MLMRGRFLFLGMRQHPCAGVSWRALCGASSQPEVEMPGEFILCGLWGTLSADRNTRWYLLEADGRQWGQHQRLSVTAPALYFL